MNIKVTDAESFEQVKKLIKDGFHPDGVGISELGDIIWGEDKFVLSEDGASDDSHVKNERRFTRFDVLIPSKRKNIPTRSWETLLSDVLNIFYYNNRYLVYVERKESENQNYTDEVKAAARLAGLGEGISDGSYKIVRLSDGDDVVYEVAVKLKLRLGGEPKPVINKFYFYKTAANSFEPAPPSRCAKIYGRIHSDNYLGDEEMRRHIEEEQSAENFDQLIFANLTSAVSSFLSKENDLSDYLVGDVKKTYEEFCEKKSENSSGGSDGAEILCDGAELRYIAKLTLPKHSFDVYDENGRAALHCFFNSDGSVTAVCARCGKELISDGAILTDDGREKRVDLNNKKEIDSLLVSDSEPAQLTPHYRAMSCNRIMGRCERICCGTELFKCPICGETLCGDCAYPEIVAQDRGGNPVHSKNTCSALCTDTLSRASINETKKCACCGRVYAKDTMKNRDGKYFCAFCLSAETEDETQIAQMEALYKLHKTMLPYHLRKSGTLCSENADFILFSIPENSGRKSVLFLKENDGELKATRVKEG